MVLLRPFTSVRACRYTVTWLSRPNHKRQITERQITIPIHRIRSQRHLPSDPLLCCLVDQHSYDSLADWPHDLYMLLRACAARPQCAWPKTKSPRPWPIFSTVIRHWFYTIYGHHVNHTRSLHAHSSVLKMALNLAYFLREVYIQLYKPFAHISSVCTANSRVAGALLPHYI